MSIKWGQWAAVLWLVGSAQPGLAKNQITDLGEDAGRTAPVDVERVKAIESQLRSEPRLRDDTIKVEVSGTTVTLLGTVDSLSEKRRAEHLVRSTDPLLKVENHLRAENEREQAGATVPANASDRPESQTEEVKGKVKKAGKKASETVQEAGEVVGDAWITSKVKSRLLSDDGVEGGTIDVDTSRKVVTLRGTVRSEAERRRAIDIARHTRGVSMVVDELKVGPAPTVEPGRTIDGRASH